MQTASNEHSTLVSSSLNWNKKKLKIQNTINPKHLNTDSQTQHKNLIPNTLYKKAF